MDTGIRLEEVEATLLCDGREAGIVTFSRHQLVEPHRVYEKVGAMSGDAAVLREALQSKSVRLLGEGFDWSVRLTAVRDEEGLAVADFEVI